MLYRRVWLAGFLLLGCAIVRAQVPAEERIRVTDPERLEALGFPRDATDVSVWSKANRNGKRAEGEQKVETTTSWGTATGLSILMHYRFQGANPYFYHLVNGASQGSWCDGAETSECLAYAQVEVPDGANLDRLHLWGYDSSVDSDLHYALIESCDLAAGHSETVIGFGDSSGSAGDFFVGSNFESVTVNNAECGYTVRIKFTDPGEPPRGVSLRLRKVRVDWRRQVSPAPVAATFGDVPTDHPYFRAIEALSASGITQGCGDENFCPGGNVTRGEMAAFLARALGLHGPGRMQAPE